MSYVYPYPGFRIVHSPKPPVRCAGICEGWIMDPTPQQALAHRPCCGDPECQRHITKMKIRRLKAAGRLRRKSTSTRGKQ